MKTGKQFVAAIQEQLTFIKNTETYIEQALPLVKNDKDKMELWLWRERNDHTRFVLHQILEEELMA